MWFAIWKVYSTCRCQNAHQYTLARSRPSRVIQTVVRTSDQNGVATIVTILRLARGMMTRFSLLLTWPHWVLSDGLPHITVLCNQHHNTMSSKTLSHPHHSNIAPSFCPGLHANPPFSGLMSRSYRTNCIAPSRWTKVLRFRESKSKLPSRRRRQWLSYEKPRRIESSLLRMNQRG